MNTQIRPLDVVKAVYAEHEESGALNWLEGEGFRKRNASLDSLAQAHVSVVETIRERLPGFGIEHGTEQDVVATVHLPVADRPHEIRLTHPDTRRQFNRSVVLVRGELAFALLASQREREQARVERLARKARRAQSTEGVQLAQVYPFPVRRAHAPFVA